MTTFNSSDYVVEPCNVYAYYCVESLSVANYPRRVATPPNCSGGSSTINYRTQSENLIEQATDMTGKIKLIPGYNCRITRKDNTLTINGSVGYGDATQRCREIPMSTEEEALLEEGKSLTGGVMCNQTLKAINGINAEDIVINGGGGVTVNAVDDHTLEIKLDTQKFKRGCD